MFSSNLTKFFASFALIFSLFSGCRFWQKTSDANSSQQAPEVSGDLKSAIPFSTKEPEQFQAEIVVTANETERKTFVARNGANRRYDFNAGAKNQVTNLQTDKNYLISPERKIYAETIAAQNVSADDWENFLTTEWLNENHEVSFEKLETVDNLTKYRVRLGAGAAASEMMILVDEQIGLPVKQEFYAVSGEQKILTYAVELKNLKLKTDDNLFAVPTDFRRVSAEEFRKILRSAD
jgi:outer membrane lipoprotein-sorting protein